MAKGNGMEPPSTNGIILIGQTRTNFNTHMKAEEPEPSMKLPPLRFSSPLSLSFGLYGFAVIQITDTI